MQKVTVSLLAVGLLAAAGLLIATDLFQADAAPTLTWQEQDEIAVATAEPAEAATAEMELVDPLRQAVATDDAALDERTPLLLRGRVVDSFRRPVAEAGVWLDFGRGGGFDRGGRQRRVPDPVHTDVEGRFAFQGQTFRNLRITLLVAHRDHAPTWFERNLGEVQQEMDLGELVIATGGELVGRVTDLDGNGVPGATVQLQPENDNRMRFRREQDLLLPASADNNGYYRLAHVAAGDWRVAATAKRHENGSSDPVPVADGQRIEVADIRLGPGYELTGVVSDVHGIPVADAEVTASVRFEPPGADGERRGGRGGRGGPGGPVQVGPGPGGLFGGNDHRTKTNAQGRFVLEHLPGSPLDLAVRKEGYLDFRQQGIDAKTAQPIYVTLQDGLVILGMVADASGAPVTTFRVTAERRAGLRQGDAAAGWESAIRQWQQGAGDPALRETMRERLGGGRRGGGDPGRGGGRGGRERKFDQHAEGRFREAGLQEGTYVVVVESPAFATWRSAELELRLGAPAPELKVTLDPGFSVRGSVRDSAGLPLANAHVELRVAEAANANNNAADNGGAGPRGGRGGRGLRGPEMRQLLAGLGSTAVTATTDRQGLFALEHAPAGRYRVVASSRGHDEGRSEPFDLAASITGVDLTLGTLGMLAGRVLGGSQEQLGQARIVAVPVGENRDLGAMFRGNNRMFGDVQQDGTYRFDELSPGSYCVRAFVGNGMRELVEQFMGGEMPADVVVKAGATAQLDVTLMVPQTGTVQGSVLHNGTPASGFHVSLRRTDENGTAPGGPFGGGRRGGGGREYSAVVDTQGRFEVRDVPAGNWLLAVSGDRRSGALHSQSVSVHAQSAAEVTISVTTSALDGQVQIADGTPLDEVDGSVTLLPGITEMPQDMAELRRNTAALRGRVQDGRFAIEMVPPGNYLAVLTIRGRERTSAQVFAALGQRSSVTLPIGAKSAAGNSPTPGRGGNAANAPGGGTEPGATTPARRGRRGQ